MLDDGRWLSVGLLVAAAAVPTLRHGRGSPLKSQDITDGFIYQGADGSWRRAAVVHRSPGYPKQGIVEYSPFDVEAWRDTLEEGEPFLRMPLTTFAAWAVERRRV